MPSSQGRTEIVYVNLVSQKHTTSGVSIEKDRQKSICETNSCIPGANGCFNLSKKLINSCNWRPYLVKLTVIHYHSPRSICPLHRPNKSIEWGCGGNYQPCFFQVLGDGIHLQVPPGVQCGFWLTIFLGRSSYNRLYLVFPTIIALIPRSGTNMEIGPVAECTYASCASWN